QNLLRRIQIEDESVQDGIFGSLDFNFGNRVLAYLVNLLIEGLNGFNGGATLGAHDQSQAAGMVKSAADSAADGVGQPFGGADTLHQPRGESATESLVENSDCIVVGIVPPDADAYHADGALVDVFFLDQVV